MRIILAIVALGLLGAVTALALDPEMDAACAIASLGDRTSQTHPHWHCIHYAAARGDRSAVAASLQNGVSANRRTGHGQTPLMLAAREGRLAVVQDLLAVDAGLQARDDRQGFTALQWAADRYHPAVARALLDAGAKVDAANRWGQTSLWQAAGRRDQGNTEIAHILVAAGADFTHADIDGNTPLLRAAHAGHRPMVAYLLELGADINGRNNRGETPLWRAVTADHADSVRLLLARGADPNDDVGGIAPLEQALIQNADNGHPVHGDIVALLRANGATGYAHYAASAARRRGRDAYTSGHYRGAIEAFSTAIRLEPESAEAFYRRGLANDDDGQHTDAAADLARALELEPGLHDAREALARLVVRDGEYARAVDLLNPLVEDQPENARALYLLGESHRGLGEVDRAVGYFKRACTLGFKQACAQAK